MLPDESFVCVDAKGTRYTVTRHRSYLPTTNLASTEKTVIEGLSIYSVNGVAVNMVSETVFEIVDTGTRIEKVAS